MKVYIGVDKSGYINILFNSSNNKPNLYFDGINFSWKENFSYLENLSMLDYKPIADNLCIEKITQDFDISYIQISNGDVFQIFSMLNDNEAEQQLAIYDVQTKNTSTPLGISAYEAAVKRANEAVEIEIM